MPRGGVLPLGVLRDNKGVLGCGQEGLEAGPWSIRRVRRPRGQAGLLPVTKWAGGAGEGLGTSEGLRGDGRDPRGGYARGGSCCPSTEDRCRVQTREGVAETKWGRVVWTTRKTGDRAEFPPDTPTVNPNRVQFPDSPPNPPPSTPTECSSQTAPSPNTRHCQPQLVQF